MNILPGNRTSSSENELPKSTSTPVKYEKKKRKSKEEDSNEKPAQEEVRLAPVKLVPTLGALESLGSLEQLGSLEELERFALFPQKKFDFDQCVPSKEWFWDVV